MSFVNARILNTCKVSLFSETAASLAHTVISTLHEGKSERAPNSARTWSWGAHGWLILHSSFREQMQTPRVMLGMLVYNAVMFCWLKIYCLRAARNIFIVLFTCLYRKAFSIYDIFARYFAVNGRVASCLTKFGDVLQVHQLQLGPAS